jgi:hypothetical protein
MNQANAGKSAHRLRAWASVGAAVVIGVVGGITLWILENSGYGASTSDSGTILQWLFAVLPGGIILTHLVYLVSSRRKQYREALGPMNNLEANKLEDLYFGLSSLLARYLAPAILVTILCGMIMGALVNPRPSFGWLFQAAPPSPTPAPPPGSVNPPAAKTDTATPGYWPIPGWPRQTLRGAALGFLGAYVYLLLLLTDRARQHDITAGIATWSAAMPVLGLLMGGVAALLITAGTGSGDVSFTRDAVFFVAGMLPRQFAAFIQSGVQKMFQQGTAPTIRTLPLTMLRGVGTDVAARLEEEGIHDVSALAYASPHQLIRATTYAPRQIVDWIDESLLIATVPSQWEALEKAGVTGALDLAWYQDHQDAIAALATEIKLDPALLAAIVFRLWQDAQVEELRQLYWDKTSPVLLQYLFKPDLPQDGRDRTVREINAIGGVSAIKVEGDNIGVTADKSYRDGIDCLIRGKEGVLPRA